MKKYIIPTLLCLSFALNLLLIWFFVFRGEVIEPQKQRKAVLMTPQNREVVLGEMRNFLFNLQQINEGMLENNPEKIITAARRSGHSSTEKVPQGLMKSLPFEFKQMGMGVHTMFDQLSDSVRLNYSQKSTQKQLNKIMNSCVACHQIYQIKTKNQTSPKL